VVEVEPFKFEPMGQRHGAFGHQPINFFATEQRVCTSFSTQGALVCNLVSYGGFPPGRGDLTGKARSFWYLRLPN
jgi:hypothetical protein